MSQAQLYLKVCYLGMIPSIMYNMGTGILRAVGDSRRPLYFLIAASITNIALDFLFVVVMHMGVLGVALGTILSQTVAAVLTMLSLIKTENCYRFEWMQMRFDGPVLTQIVRIGLPAGLQSVMYSLSNMVVQGSVNAFGTNVVAAYTAYGKIDSVFWMSMNSFGLAITTVVGQNFGARKYDRVKKVFGSVPALPFWALVYCWQWLCRLDIISIGSLYRMPKLLSLAWTFCISWDRYGLPTYWWKCSAVACVVPAILSFP
ncbi:MATE efflux family protein [gut metagenome]|uniref:MATE efflux family protein n=1 Tax=gut metagenome TaxID=749906 RepID=J9GJ34_9ZZZZ